MTEIRRLDSPEELDSLFAASSEGPVWLFKHSLTCSVSAAAWRRFRSFVDGRPPGEAAYALIEVQPGRTVSNAAAERTGVRHESPQVLLLRGGAAIWHASHWQITEPALAEALTEQTASGTKS